MVVQKLQKLIQSVASSVIENLLAPIIHRIDEPVNVILRPLPPMKF